jgi:hypothetical protein
VEEEGLTSEREKMRISFKFWIEKRRKSFPIILEAQEIVWNYFEVILYIMDIIMRSKILLEKREMLWNNI